MNYVIKIPCRSCVQGMFVWLVESFGAHGDSWSFVIDPNPECIVVFYFAREEDAVAFNQAGCDFYVDDDNRVVVKWFHWMGFSNILAKSPSRP